MAEREGCEVMARPSKGSGARSEIVHVRLTPQEVGALTARFGSAGKAMRALLDDWTRSEVTRGGPRVRVKEPLPATAPLDVEAMRNPQEVAALDGVVNVGPNDPGSEYVMENGVITEVIPGTTIPKTHRHRRGAVIRVDYVYGTPKQIYGCLECGEELA